MADTTPITDALPGEPSTVVNGVFALDTTPEEGMELLLQAHAVITLMTVTAVDGAGLPVNDEMAHQLCAAASTLLAQGIRLVRNGL